MTVTYFASRSLLSARALGGDGVKIIRHPAPFSSGRAGHGYDHAQANAIRRIVFQIKQLISSLFVELFNRQARLKWKI